MGCRGVVVRDVASKDVVEDVGGAIADGNNIDAGRVSLAGYIKQGIFVFLIMSNSRRGLKTWMAVDAEQILVFKLGNEGSVNIQFIRAISGFCDL